MSKCFPMPRRDLASAPFGPDTLPDPKAGAIKAFATSIGMTEARVSKFFGEEIQIVLLMPEDRLEVVLSKEGVRRLAALGDPRKADEFSRWIDKQVLPHFPA